MSQEERDPGNNDSSVKLEDFLSQENQEKFKAWTQDARHWVEAHPWAALAGALAIGYLVGSMTSRRERDPR